MLLHTYFLDDLGDHVLSSSPRPTVPFAIFNMAVFVDLDDDDVDLPQHNPHALKPIWALSPSPSEPSTANTATNGQDRDQDAHGDGPSSSDRPHRDEAAHESAVQECPNSLAVALRCYP